jgi:DNA (cytosine-5)-methyltransferase 1
MKALSLFSNVGFGELYLGDIGVDVVVANELCEDRCNLYKEIHPNCNVVCGDIANEKTKVDIYESCPDAIFEDGINLIIATPPCQGMSVANAKRLPDDSRNSLIIHAMDIFNDLLPDYMLIENVSGMAETFINVDGDVINIIEYIKSTLPEPWQLNWKILDAKDYGTPQSRKRFIGLISKDGKWKHPKPQKKLISVRDAIGHLPSLESGESSKFPWHYAKKHNENHIKWMRNTPTGKTAFNNKIYYPQKDGRRIKGFMTTYKRIEWDKPSPTVTMCNGAISSQNNVHPGTSLSDGIYSDARVLSVMELAILCGIPEDFLNKFKNKYPESFLRRVLGECFPPKTCLEIIKNIPNGNG